MTKPRQFQIMSSENVYAGILAMVVVLSGFTTIPVSAGGVTQVSLQPANQTVAADGTVTYDLVVNNADGGVGAYEYTIEVSDSSVAEITDISLGGNPSHTDVNIADDGSSVSVAAALADTADTGSVTIATVTVQGQSAGDVDITANIADLGDETGDTYSVTGVSNGTLTVSSSNTPPTADAGPDRTVTGGQSVELDGTGSSDPDGDSLSYSWSGTSYLSDVSSPTPTFHAPDVGSTTTYTAELEVTDGNGGSDTDTVSITVEPANQPPTADITISPLTPETDDSVTFDASGSTDPDGPISSYEWSIDGMTSTGETVTRTFSDDGEYTVELTVTGNEGETDTTTQTVRVSNREPTAEIAVSPSSPATGESVTFDASGSSDPDGSITSYEWSINGETEFGESVTRSFSDDGEYTVELTVTDDDGETDTTTQRVNVRNQDPTAEFAISPSSPETGKSVTFDASGSSDPDGSINSYEWSIDGTSYTGEIVEHTFTDAGEYTAELTVIDDDGATSTTTNQVSVTAQETTTEQPQVTTTDQSQETATEQPQEATTDQPQETATDQPQETTTSGPSSEDDNDQSLPWVPIGVGGGALVGVTGLAAWQLRSDDDEDGDSPPATPEAGSTPPATPDSTTSTDDPAQTDQPPSDAPTQLAYDEIEKEERIGSGGNADVYRGTIQGPHGPVDIALKEPRIEGTLSASAVEELLEEAETWHKLDDNEHIVDVLGWGAEPLPWIAMEYMDGGNLSTALPLEYDRGVDVLHSVASAVEYAHRTGISHGDLKPANVLFAGDPETGVAKVGDWGLAQILLEHSRSTEGLSPAYAAPEQFDGGSQERLGPQLTDVYQLGAVAYEVFTGRPPFEGTPFEVMKQVRSEQPTPPTEIDPSLPATVDEIVATAMAKDPSERYETMTDLRRALEEL